MTINERIKTLRKDNKLNQKQFAAALGVTQSGVSYMEQSGSTVSDASIKTICSIYNVNEEWLRTGAEPMYNQTPTFILDDFVKQRGASQLELDIVKAYFELEPDLRRQLVQHFKDKLSETETAEPAEPTTEQLEAEYKKSRLNSVQNTGLSASNTTAATGTDKAAGNE